MKNIKKELQEILAIASDTTPRDFYGEETEPTNFESALATSWALINTKKAIQKLIDQVED